MIAPKIEYESMRLQYVRPEVGVEKFVRFLFDIGRSLV
jgi:hypothetical protein